MLPVENLQLLMAGVSYKLSLGDATRICTNKMMWIRKQGTGRQRDEGIKLLKRIVFRLDEIKYKQPLI
jgi:hypothetical protein